MKLTNILLKHNKQRWRRYQWRAKGWQVKRHSYAKQTLDEHNIPYENALDFVKDPKPIISFDYDRVFNPPAPIKNASHPDYKEIPCLIFRDKNVLVEGLEQAKVLTNSVEVEDDLPEAILKLKEEHAQSDDVHTIVKKSLFSALVYDGHQEKLPHRFDPERPAWKFPRDYGIVDSRRNMLVTNKLLQLVESLSNEDISSKAILDNASFQLNVKKDDDLVQFQLRGDKVITSESPLPSFAKSVEKAASIELPNFYPLKSTISLSKEHFYKTNDVFPLHKEASHPFIHTAIVHYNDTEVKNAFATPVTDTQVLSRSLVKAFVMAATQARYLYGDDVQDLPSPYTLQLVQTDARMFHFCAFQLNTLNLASTNTSTRNIFWSHPILQLSSDWGYNEGIPYFSGYNSHVFDLMFAFYKYGSSQRNSEAIKSAATSV